MGRWWVEQYLGHDIVTNGTLFWIDGPQSKLSDSSPSFKDRCLAREHIRSLVEPATTFSYKEILILVAALEMFSKASMENRSHYTGGLPFMESTEKDLSSLTDKLIAAIRSFI